MWKLTLVGVIWLLSVAHTATANDPVTWWVTDVSQKITSATVPPLDSGQSIHLHAARQEYAPFQIVFSADSSVVLSTPIIDYPDDYFSLQLYEEFFVPLQYIPEPEIFSMARLMDVDTIADGLKPTGDTITVPAEYPAAIWVDLYVLPGTPAGDYVIAISLPGYGKRPVTVTVYPVDLQPIAAMNVVIPLEADWTIPRFAHNDDIDAFQRAVNQLMIDHSIVPGTLTGLPKFTSDGWDFSAFDEELAALPHGAIFYTPLPFDEWHEQYLITGTDGAVYSETRFDDAEFADAIVRFFEELVTYLEDNGHLAGALVYPVDETRWVADEPDHNGPEGYLRLAEWTKVIRAAGLRVSASRVTPATYSPDWLSSANITDDVHVHVDLFDSAPELYATWNEDKDHSTSVYLNEYGDLIDMPAAIHRGLIWHAYGHDIRMIAGYAAMEWVDEDYDLVDPWVNVASLYPQSGYGGGALIWPGPLPSIRLKLLREGVEDSRLLDLYAEAHGEEVASHLATSLTPGALADQNPEPDLWDKAHTALLVSLSGDTPINLIELLPQDIPVSETNTLINFDGSHIDSDRWEFGETTTATIVTAPWNDSENALAVGFAGETPYVSYWSGETDWSAWDTLEITVYSQSPYFTELDVAVGDVDGNYLLLRNGAILIGPEGQHTLNLPLIVPFGVDESFNWTGVTYFELTVNTIIRRRDGFGVEHTYYIGERSLVFGDFKLVRFNE
jgi:hypothetical protein